MPRQADRPHRDPFIIVRDGSGVGPGLSITVGPDQAIIPNPQPVAIWTSADGQAWHGRAAPRTFKGATIAAVAAGPDGIVAVGDTGWDHPAIWFSADGVSWRRESLPAAMFGHAEFWGLTLFRGRWVLTGATDPRRPTCCTGNSAKGLKAAAWFSADGRSWQRASVESPAQETIGFPFATSGGLASGGYRRNWVSADGSDWQSGPTDPDFGPVASDGERIVGTRRETTTGSSCGCPRTAAHGRCSPMPATRA